MLQKIANTIRLLTMDAVELAGSGHPGMPMGCAELGAYLFGEIDGHNLDQIRGALAPLRTHQEKPTLVIATTCIGCGASKSQDTPTAHGRPLGKEEVALAKKKLGLPDVSFQVDQDICQLPRPEGRSLRRNSHVLC